MKARRRLSILVVVILAFVFGWVANRANLLSPSAATGEAAAPKVSPTAALADRDVYYPGLRGPGAGRDADHRLRHRACRMPDRSRPRPAGSSSWATATSSSSTSGWARPSASPP